MLYEKLDVWRHSVDLSCEVYKATSELKDWGFRDQITRSALSIPSNIAEGEGRGTLKDSIRFMYIARGSLFELRTQVQIGSRIGYVDAESAAAWLHSVDAIAKMLNALIASKKRKDF